MKAAMLHGPRDVRIEDVERPALGQRAVYVGIRVYGISPSDVRFYTGDRHGATYPRMVGHEWVGEVLQVGSAVEGRRRRQPWRRSASDRRR